MYTGADHQTLPFERSKTVCEGCGNELDVIIDTDGDGGLVDHVRPCKTCERKRVLEGHLKLRCESCGRVWYRPRQVGRPPKTCPEC